MTAYDSFIEKYSEHFNINANWARAIIMTESGGNPYTLRYESSYNYLYETEKCAKLAKVTLATEIATQRISWGLAQVMGALAREQGYTGSLAQLTDPDLNISHLFIRLDYLNRLAHGNKDSIFAGYNGGPGSLRKVNNLYLNQKYVDTVNSFLEKLV